MIEETKILCITCPQGCSLKVTHDGKTVIDVKSGCKRGKEYVQRELTDPRRMVASTVKIKRGVHPLLPVYTSEPFPKGKIMELTEELRKVEVVAPVQMGAVIVANVLDTGIDIIASRDIAIKRG